MQFVYYYFFCLWLHPFLSYFIYAYYLLKLLQTLFSYNYSTFKCLWNRFLCAKDLLLLSIDFAKHSSPLYIPFIVLSILGFLATLLNCSSNSLYFHCFFFFVFPFVNFLSSLKDFYCVHADAILNPSCNCLLAKKIVLSILRPYPCFEVWGEVSHEGQDVTLIWIWQS